MSTSFRALLVTLLALASPAMIEAKESETPNILIILADDLGIDCLPLFGGHHVTPNIDKLASEGMTFTHCFSNPYCSPSRASLLTGRYPFQHGITQVLWHEQKHANLYLKPDQPSFARQLKQAGYRTAIAGKWQLSFLHQRNFIPDFGFDQFQVWQIFKADGQKSTRFRQPHFNRNGTVLSEEIKDRYGPDVNVDFLIDFMKASKEANTPFLAYHTSLLPHYPWVPTPDSTDQDYVLEDTTGRGDPRYFPDMVKYLDKLVGRMMAFLKSMELEDNTIVFFLADNGTDQHLVNTWGDNKQLKGGKGSMTDRGTRVPLIVRWPGHIQANVTCDDLIDFSDLLPTLCDIAKAPLPEQSIHGHSFLPQLLGETGTPRKWVHVQDKTTRHLRSHDYILNNKNELRPVVEIWEDPAPSNQNVMPEKEQAARAYLQGVFDTLNQK
jgi:arylsulfatase A